MTRVLLTGKLPKRLLVGVATEIWCCGDVGDVSDGDEERRPFKILIASRRLSTSTASPTGYTIRSTLKPTG